MNTTICEPLEVQPQARAQPPVPALPLLGSEMPAPKFLHAALPALGRQKICLNGLRFNATLGVLSFEKKLPQPIQVDAELNLGPQPLLPLDDTIGQVLDYREVRTLIIDECCSEHVNLLETMIGRLSHRLMSLPGVRGVRIRIAKLEIFDDCEVAIRVETGLW